MRSISKTRKYIQSNVIGILLSGYILYEEYREGTVIIQKLCLIDEGAVLGWIINGNHAYALYSGDMKTTLREIQRIEESHHPLLDQIPSLSKLCDWLTEERTYRKVVRLYNDSADKRYSVKYDEDLYMRAVVGRRNTIMNVQRMFDCLRVLGIEIIEQKNPLESDNRLVGVQYLLNWLSSQRRFAGISTASTITANSTMQHMKMYFTCVRNCDVYAKHMGKSCYDQCVQIREQFYKLKLYTVVRYNSHFESMGNQTIQQAYVIHDCFNLNYMAGCKCKYHTCRYPGEPCICKCNHMYDGVSTDITRRGADIDINGGEHSISIRYCPVCGALLRDDERSIAFKQPSIPNSEPDSIEIVDYDEGTQ
jgi:hypothetical protein